MYGLRKGEGKDLGKGDLKLGLYAVLGGIRFVVVLVVLWGVRFEGKLYSLIWLVVGIVI
ncbi:hypothetical protein [Staphylococcus capitis]|uniref:hypothetical protein n=1 Tax=Staphylococcus capitis TaxID=29388 RepID=UPI00164245E5|nr:hypothetical protein [Staphylococcus capitis]